MGAISNIIMICCYKKRLSATEMGVVSNNLWISCYKNTHQQQKWAPLATLL